MSDLYTVAEQLESLNSRSSELYEGIDAVNRSIQALRQDNANSPGGSTSVLGGILSDGMGAAVTILATGFKAMQEAAQKFEKLQIQSLTTGVDMRAVISTIADQNKEAGDDLKQSIADNQYNFAGLLEAAKAQVDSAKVGLNVFKNVDAEGKDQNHSLRNVIGLLDKQGHQGQAVISHFQDLIRRGYSEEQARLSVESFANIALHSLQTSDNTKKLLDQFKQVEAMQALIGGQMGEGLQAALQGLAPDVEGQEILGKSIASIMMPKSKQDIQVASILGEERIEFLEEFQRLGEVLAKIGPEGEGREAVLGELRKVTSDFLELNKETLVRISGLEGVGTDGLDLMLPGLVTQSSQINETMQIAINNQEALGILQQQKVIGRISTEEPELRRDANLNAVVRGLETTLTFQLDRINDTIMGNSEVMETFRDATAVATRMAFRGIENILESVDTEALSNSIVELFSDSSDTFKNMFSRLELDAEGFSKALREASTEIDKRGLAGEKNPSSADG